MSLRAHLVALVVAALLPVLLFSCFVVVLLAREQQANVDRGLRETARALALAVDKEIDRTVASLRVLGASDRLSRGDLAGFHALARRVVASDPDWLLVGLATPEGRHVLNTDRPYGTALPPLADRPVVQAVLRSGESAVGDLVRGRVSGRTSVIVGVPVEQNGKVRFVLFAAIDPFEFSRILDAQGIPPEWTAAVLDRERRILARSRASAAMMGRPATPTLAAASRTAGEGTFRDVTQEGRPTYGAFSRAPRTGWTVVLGVPAETFGAAARRAFWLVVLGGLALALVALVVAGLLGRRIARPIGTLARAAAALGRGEVPTIPRCSVTEVDRVGREIEDAATRLARAEAERDELLARERAARAEAEAALQARDAFLARASHELRTPLTSAVATLRLLERARTERLDVDPAELLRIAARNVDAMLALTNSLLDASKLTAGQEGLTLEPLDVERLAATALELVAVQARDKRVEVASLVDPGTVLVADRLKLEQVLVNLLANAVRFTPAGGAVTVEAGPEGGGDVVIRVRDTGEGIAPEELERIFEPFYQAGAPRRRGREARGTGLGLAICRQIVTLHGGRIWAESEGRGRGSTFVVVLPGLPDGGRQPKAA